MLSTTTDRPAARAGVDQLLLPSLRLPVVAHGVLADSVVSRGKAVRGRTSSCRTPGKPIRITHSMVSSPGDELFTRWLASLEARHLADFRSPRSRGRFGHCPPRMSNAARNLRPAPPSIPPGKRAAFALFYGPLHLLTIGHIVRCARRQTRLRHPISSTLAAVQVSAAPRGRSARAASLESPASIATRWAVEESRRTYRELGLRGQARTEI